MFTWQMFYLQDSSSPNTDYLYMFHDLAMLLIIMIISMILFLMFSIIKSKRINRFLLQGNLIEIIWTLMPIFILSLLAIPSMKILYFLDESWLPVVFTVKCLGHQWFWSYEYSDFGNQMLFDSYMNNEIRMNSFRLLDVDNRVVVPVSTPVRILSSSTDVIHSWAVPSLGVKVDSVPGRLNQSMIVLIAPGLFFGQCSEICGANHSFMPIVVEGTSSFSFKKWIKKLFLCCK